MAAANRRIAHCVCLDLVVLGQGAGEGSGYRGLSHMAELRPTLDVIAPFLNEAKSRVACAGLTTSGGVAMPFRLRSANAGEIDDDVDEQAQA